MWADNESTVDFLGFEVHRDLIRDVVTDERLLPVTVGLFGDWGGGKSSVMQMLKANLDENKDVACLYFNGWTFEGYDDAKSALLTSILLQLGEHKHWGAKVRDKIVPLLKRVNYFRLATLGIKRGSGLALTAGAGLAAAHGVDPGLAASLALMGAGMHMGSGAPDSANESELDEPKHGDAIDWDKLIKADKSKPSVLDIRTFRADFQKLLSETDLKSVVVLIDDLDRCSPERLIENLEAIKLFLSVEKTAFVIAADPRIVRHAVATRFSAPRISDELTTVQEQQLTTDYLEKLVQVPYTLPRLSPSEMATYMTLLFCQLHLTTEQFEIVRNNCSDLRKKNPSTVFGKGAVQKALPLGLSKELEATLQWSGTIEGLLQEGLKGNPRQVKRFLNALLLRKKLASIAGVAINDEVLVKLMLLEYSRKLLFDQLYIWQSGSDGKPDQLRKLEVAARATQPPKKKKDDEAAETELAAWREKWVQDWLQLDPLLADVDLRDYYWVARDQISEGLTGLALVSPLVRRLFGSLTGGNDALRRSVVTGVQELDANDLAALLRQLGQNVQQHSESLDAINGLVVLAEAGVAGASSSLVTSFNLAPVASLNAAAPYRIKIVINTRPETVPEFRPLLERWSQTTARVAVGAQSVLKDLTPKVTGG